MVKEIKIPLCVRNDKFLILLKEHILQHIVFA